MKELAPRILESPGRMLTYDGKELHIWFDVSVTRLQICRLRFLTVNSQYEQGVAISVDHRKGKAIVDERPAVLAALWAGRENYTFKCQTKREEGILSITNIWTLSQAGVARPVVSLGIKNAGLYADRPAHDSYVFHCSCGLGAVDFEDLVFELELVADDDVLSV